MLSCSYFNSNGDIEYVKIPIPKEERYDWDTCDKSDKHADKVFSSWDGKSVKKKFSNRLSKYRIEEILLKHKDGLALPLQQFNQPKKYFVDIEVEVVDGFPDPETVQSKVTAISIAGADSKRVLVMGLKELTEEQCRQIDADINKHFAKFGDKWNFQYVQYQSEFELLDTFFTKLMPTFPCISGWNFSGYDWPYLINRAELINKSIPTSSRRIDISKCSPSGKLLGKNRYPEHRLIVDYLDIYKKWDRVIKIRENDRLDYVGKMAVGIEKIKYPGTLKDLYEKDFQKFIFYNAVDSVLVHYIDKKLNTMLAYFKLAHIAGIEVKKAFSPIAIMEAVMCRRFLERNQVFIKMLDNDEEQRDFEGAYVKDPVKGFHKWVTCYDFASLYPNTICQFNISPETFVGNNVIPQENQIKVGEHVNDDGTITWRTFKNDEDSILRLIISDLYKHRKMVKNKYLDVNKDIDVLERRLKGETIKS